MTKPGPVAIIESLTDTQLMMLIQEAEQAADNDDDYALDVLAAAQTEAARRSRFAEIVAAIRRPASRDKAA